MQLVDPGEFNMLATRSVMHQYCRFRVKRLLLWHVLDSSRKFV
jgi:hypothetical protein